MAETVRQALEDPISNVLDRDSAVKTADFLLYSSWTTIARRPGSEISWTLNWPYEPSVGDTLGADIPDVFPAQRFALQPGASEMSSPVLISLDSAVSGAGGLWPREGRNGRATSQPGTAAAAQSAEAARVFAGWVLYVWRATTEEKG